MDSVRIGLPPRTPTGRIRRYSFGTVWCKNVLNGTARDHDKMIAHGLWFMIGCREELAALPYGDLMELVQHELKREIVTRYHQLQSTIEPSAQSCDKIE